MRTPEEIAAVTDWAEQRGMENLREHVTAMGELKEDANRTLAIFMAVAGASLAYVANNLASPESIALVAGVFSVGLHFVLIGALLLHYCLKISDAPVVANQASNLFNPAYSVQQLKAAEIANLEVRRKFAVCRNEVTGRWLNRLRYAALASPITFTIVYCFVTRSQISF